ncbi:MAG: 16S rRNA (guanine(527)-N(7))-methyltransferase RsmG [Planctomycetes bacterium]|nr:16S rRNA (guanine(527)-N(7))-methyltransferase RsmG [Planctomycetota bacterium]
MIPDATGRKGRGQGEEEISRRSKIASRELGAGIERESTLREEGASPLSPHVTALEAPAPFLRAVEELGIEFEGAELSRLGLYLAHLLDTTRRFNLTAIRDPEQAWTRHILDSLSLFPLLVTQNAKRVADVGSGGGLPGLPLAILLPRTRFSLIEATGKKARFLAAVAERLALANVAVCEGRAEMLAHDRAVHRESYDAVLARAVGPLATLIELTAPFAKVGGLIVAIKGERAAAEVAAAKRALEALRLAVEKTRRTATGTLVILRKNQSTPRGFPRRPGEPAHNPLGVSRGPRVPKRKDRRGV